MQSFTSIDYSVQLDIRNIQTLPKGTGCKFLLCLLVETGTTFHLIAKSWHRKKPNYQAGNVVVMF